MTYAFEMDLPKAKLKFLICTSSSSSSAAPGTENQIQKSFLFQGSVPKLTALTAPVWSCVQGGKQSLDSYSLEIGSLLLRINESTSEMSIFSSTEKQCLCILLIKRVIERTLVCNLVVFIKSTYCKYC